MTATPVNTAFGCLLATPFLGARIAWYSILGLISALLTCFGVNDLPSGLHSYA